MVATTRRGWISEFTKLILILALYSVAGTAAAQSACDATYTFDGDLSDSSGNGYDGTAFGRGDLPGSPQFAEGISGQALLFDGKTGVYTDLDLHFDRCPQVTVTGWLRLNTREPSGSNYIFSVGDWGPHGVYVWGRSVVLRGRGNGLQIKHAMRDERAWFFFAGVYDFDAGTFRLKFRNRTAEGKLPDTPREPSGETFFGARDERLTSPAKDIYLDEVKIFGRALSDDEIGRVAAQVTSKPWLTAISHSAARGGAGPREISIPEDARTTRPPIGPTSLPGRGLDSDAPDPQSDGSLDGAPSAAGLDASPTLEPGLAEGLVADFGLDGEWVRRDSNNDRNDGMRITVSNGQAVLSYVPPTATSNWHEGEILWQDIGSKGTLQVLGSNNAFYDAEIIVESADVLHIDIDANGPGNDQSWERANAAKLADRLDLRSPPADQQNKVPVPSGFGESGPDQYGSVGRGAISAPDPAMVEAVREHRERNAPPDIGYASEEEALAAAEARAEQQEAERAAAEQQPPAPEPTLRYDAAILVHSGVSGATGDYTERVVYTPSQSFPFWIETRENYDKPCTVYVHFQSHGEHQAGLPISAQEFDVCDEGLPRINPLTTLHRVLNSPRAHEYKLITALQVCNNGINNRVKGIRAQVRVASFPTGNHSTNYETVVFQERSNCLNWKPLAKCEANTFAVGLTLHFRDGDLISPRDFLSGIELACTSIRWEEVAGGLSGVNL